MTASILVVEDNPANRLLISSLLERSGYRPLLAGSTEEARNLLRDVLPDLVLMDVQLPGEDGLSLVRELRAEPATAELPIVAVTANAMAGDRDAALAAGCSGYISKPIDTRSFAAEIGRYLDGAA